MQITAGAPDSGWINRDLVIPVTNHTNPAEPEPNDRRGSG